MSRFLDERGRIFGKVNVVDILVLLVIVAVVVFAVVRMTGDSSTTVPVRVTYTATEVPKAAAESLAELLRAKGSVTDDGGTYLGKVDSFTVVPALKEYLTPEGVLEQFESPILRDVNIVVLGEGRISGDNLRAGSILLAEGEKVTLVGEGFKRQAVITDVAAGAKAAK